MFRMIGKLLGSLVLWILLSAYFNRKDMLTPLGILSLCLFFVVPPVFAAIRRSRNEARWRRQTEIERSNRENHEEYTHQLALRRERERLEMQAEVRVRELISTLEAQYQMDSRKLEQLAKLKADFANRQQADMHTLLGQLEAMRAGAQ